jgi:hypothetical protein
LSDALEELGNRAWSLSKWGLGGFAPAGAEEGFFVSQLAIVELGVGLTTVIGGIAFAAFLIATVAPPIAAYLEYVNNEADYKAYFSNVQREILDYGGYYPGIPADLGRIWTADRAQQERLKAILNLDTTPATAAGPGLADDQTTDDLQSLIKNSPRSNMSTSSNNRTGSVQSVRSSSVPRSTESIDEAAMQRARLNTITSGDIARYNQLIEEHKVLYRKHGVNPCKSGFFPQGCQ